MPATQAELEAILHGAAVAQVARAFLRITGSDATRWLNGMVTNSTQALAPGEGNYNFLLNAQGRIQADCIIYRESNGGEPTFLLATDIYQLEAIRNMLDRFIIMDDVELTAPLAEEATFVILGPKAPAVLRSLGLSAIDPICITQANTEVGPILLSAPVPGQIPCFELTAPPATIAALRSRITAPEPSGETLNAARIFFGVPVFGIDIRDRDLPQETNQTQALHFAKGCYLGQEIVERIRSRGQVHRLLTRFRLEGDLPTSLPAPLESDGKPAGELTSAALVPLPEGPQLYALGYARREFLDLKKSLTYAAGIATPAPHLKTDN